MRLGGRPLRSARGQERKLFIMPAGAHSSHKSPAIATIHKLMYIARFGCACLAAAVIMMLAGCASQSYFVDGSLKDISVSHIQQLDRPRPVQLLFSFKTRGLVDARTSDILESDVTRVVASSGLFSTVIEGPAPGGAILNVTIERFLGTGGEVSRGLASGLTLGLAGSTRKDPFVCAVDYISSQEAKELTATAEHAIYMPLGVMDFRPKDIVIAKSWIDALRTVTRQSVTRSLQQLSQSPTFRKEAQAP